jgi:predicted GNAT family acetyltransferase
VAVVSGAWLWHSGGARQARPGGYDPGMSETPASSGGDIEFVDNPTRSRYEARIGERVLGVVDYILDPDAGRIVLDHTEVMPDAEGRGVGSLLAKGALDDVRARGLAVVVDCPFIAAWIKRHREYADLASG